MGQLQTANTPYDDVFRTLLNDCSPLILPLINEVFDEAYSGTETILFSPNEHFLNRQDGKEEERITDSSFKILGKETKNFDKNLLLLIPFHIFSHEKRLAEYEKDISKREALQKEYKQIREKLEELLERGILSEYTKRTLIDLSNKVLDHIAVKYNSVRKGVKSVMGGRVLDYEAKKSKEKGLNRASNRASGERFPY